MSNLEPSTMKAAAKADVAAVRTEARSWIASHPFKTIGLAALAVAALCGALYVL